METHVKVLGFLQILLGSLGVVMAGFLVLVFGGAASVLGTAGDRDAAAIAIPVIGIIGTGIAMFILAISVPGIVVGIGLLRFRPWARVLGLILSSLLLIHVPLGTVVGAYGLWVLLTADTERLFRTQTSGASGQTDTGGPRPAC